MGEHIERILATVRSVYAENVSIMYVAGNHQLTSRISTTAKW